jgi:hypothetical protein
MPETIFMKLGMYIMAPEPISGAYFINPYHQSVCQICISPIVARQRLGKHVPAATNTRNNRRIVGRVVLYAIRVVAKESIPRIIPRNYYVIYSPFSSNIPPFSLSSALIFFNLPVFISAP